MAEVLSRCLPKEKVTSLKCINRGVGAEVAIVSADESFAILGSAFAVIVEIKLIIII